MSKIILFIMTVFICYLFINMSASAKQEVMKQTMDIPNKAISAVQQFTNNGGK